MVNTFIYLEKDGMFCLHMACLRQLPFRPPELQEETELQKVSLVMQKPSNLD